MLLLQTASSGSGQHGASGGQSQYIHMKEMARVEELGRMLTTVQNTLNKSSSECNQQYMYMWVEGRNTMLLDCNW